MQNEWIISPEDPILVTGSNGFIGVQVVQTLIQYGFRNIRCFVRPSSDTSRLEKSAHSTNPATIRIIKGDLLSPEACVRASKDIAVVFHLATVSSRSYAGVFMGTVISTRNLLDANLKNSNLRRFLNVSSLAVYSNREIRRGRVLDETCQVDSEPESRYDAYAYGKIKQDELLLEYGKKFKIPYVIVRPGAVYGPGKAGITGRVGIDTFGMFLHLGGRNRIPFTYVDNCAEAIVLAGLRKGVESNVFNIIDDELPTSRWFLRMYKKNVCPLRSLSIPYSMIYMLCFLWEKYSKWSRGQVPPIFNRSRCITEWGGNLYSNNKTKELLGWKQKVDLAEAMKRYFEYQKANRGGI